MDLYLIRHAEAVPREDVNGVADEDRPLTDAGRDQCRALAAALQAHHITFQKVVTSPLVRSRQTAEALIEHGPAPKPELLECDVLAPGGRSKKITRCLLGLEGDAIAVVGHMPDLGEYLGWLIGEKKVSVTLAKAGVARIRFDGAPDKGAGELAWLVTPLWYEPAGKAVASEV
jgi:phosphohistidine phosphatase